VIGAGVAGLVAALTLQALGRRCVLFERAGRVGGCCATLDEGGVSYEPGASILIGREITSAVLEPFDIDPSPLLVPDELVVRAVFADDTLELRAPIQALIGELRARCASDARAFDALIASFASIANRLVDGLWGWKLGSGLARLQLARLIPWFLPSYEAILRGRIRDWRLRSTLEAFSDFYAGMPAHRAPAVVGLIPALALGEGSYRVRGGIQRLPELLADHITKAGGTIHLGEDVRAISVERGRVTGLRLDAGDLEVAGVVAACDLRCTLGMLPNLLSLRGLRLYASLLEPSPSACCLILDTSQDDGAQATWLIGDGDSARRDGRFWSQTAFMAGPLVDGRSGARLGGAIAGSGEHPDASEVREHLIGAFGAVGMQVTGSPVLSWTPADYESRFGLFDGQAFGFMPGRLQLGPGRYGPATPITNLVVAGQSTFPGFGIPLSMLSGRIAATVLGRTA
jgi:phytoene desaturase